jgi:hypothetical protein
MKGKFMILKASLYDINKDIEANDLKECPLEEIVSEQYLEFLPLFSTISVNWLPPHRPGMKHEVRLTERETHTWGHLYGMSRTELVVLNEWLEENMFKGYIRQSSSSFAAPVVFAKKPDGEL